jgi:AAHS family 4-hydroxybenzoate transporter-like MFS transporter
MTSGKAIDIKAFIDERPISPYQWLLVALCFLVVTADGMDVAIMGFIAPAIIHDWGISRPAFGLVMSAAPLGLVIGALAAGPASDRVGLYSLPGGHGYLATPNGYWPGRGDA